MSFAYRNADNLKLKGFTVKTSPVAAEFSGNSRDTCTGRMVANSHCSGYGTCHAAQINVLAVGQNLELVSAQR